MTPDEVKQLHYKTIIFPIIGFPIFRDTILYNKFSCYKSGMIERTINPLKDLSNTYFTVEDISHEITSRRYLIPKEIKEHYESLELSDKEKLKSLELVIEKIFKTDYEIKYNTTINHRVYMSVNINRELKQKDRSLLNNKIKSELYHVEVKEYENKTVLNIHNENQIFNSLANKVVNK